MIFLDYGEVTFRLPSLLSKHGERIIDWCVGVAGRTIPCRIRNKIARERVNCIQGNEKMPGNNRNPSCGGTLWKIFLNHM
jgi:hypothetical protein